MDKISINNVYGGGGYEMTDSEEEYSESEKKLLKQVRQPRKIHDEKQEVMRFDETESEDDENIVHASDLEDDEEYDHIPDSKAWGKKRSTYYNTDFVDQDYSTYNEKEIALAEQEEQDAREIQQRLAKQLEEADFSLDVYAEPNESNNDIGIDKVKVDLSDLPIRQREQLFQKDSPEFAGLMLDFEKYLKESQEILSPITKQDSGQISHPLIDFTKHFNTIILTYCTNISFYLLLKAKRIPIKNHPIVKRLVQIKQLLEKLNVQYEDVIKPQLGALLAALEEGKDVFGHIKTIEQKPSRRMYIKEELDSVKNQQYSNNVTEDEESSMDDITLEEGDSRRPITYQIAKNKGLTPHRKKELRNPRVKHRNKYRKALIRRKGAVRTVRKEIQRYSGEISGIKANVKKGIKIKS